MKALTGRARETDAGLRSRPAATRDLPTIACFRAGPLLRRSEPVPGILAAARPGAIMDKSGRHFVATKLMGDPVRRAQSGPRPASVRDFVILAIPSLRMLYSHDEQFPVPHPYPPLHRFYPRSPTLRLAMQDSPRLRGRLTQSQCIIVSH